MIKKFVSFITVFLLSFTVVFASQNSGNNDPHMRKDIKKHLSHSDRVKLHRAEYLLSSLVQDPESYTLLLSSNNTFGGEAYAPGALSDKPTILLYQGALTKVRSNEEIAFMMAHELGHLNLHHNEKMSEQMDKILNGPPLGISGSIFAVFHQKQQEREADMFGLHLYAHAGYDLNFFPKTLKSVQENPCEHLGIKPSDYRELSTLSMKDSHFSMKERFQLLTNESYKIA